MKIEAKEFDGSNHRRLIIDSKKDIGLLYLGVDGHYYYEPHNDLGFWSASRLRDVADFLDKINKPFDELVKKDLGVEATTTLILDEIGDFIKITSVEVGSKVKIRNRGYLYSTYAPMFHKLGFKNPEERKTLPAGKKITVENIIFTIFNIGIHEDGATKLYAIRDDEGNEYLFSKGGLKFL